MTCCTPTIIPFTDKSTVSVAYSPFMIEQYGEKPNVQVYYKDGAEYVLSDDLNSVRFDGATVEVDNGGPNTGFVKIF